MSTTVRQPGEFPPVAELVPHSGALVLLDRIVAVEEESLTAAIQVTADGLYNHGDAVPAWVAMEYMAQAVAAFAGLESYRNGDTIPLGFLLGSRKVEFNSQSFPVGSVLTVTVKRILQDDSGMAVFECHLSGDDTHSRNIQASARLNLYQPIDSDAFLRDHND
ncbi:MAG: hypothetical protein ABJQ78_05275 [Alloalcanivorax sp.]